MITTGLMERVAPTKGIPLRKYYKYNLVKNRKDLVDALNRILPKYDINSYRRVCAFLATCGIETDYFKTTIEYASGAAYEGRKDLGNTVRGDGKRFRGRSCIQTTGRYNYFRVVIRYVKKLTGVTYSDTNPKLLTEATRLGCNFIDHPELLGNIEVAVEAACIFWQENKLNKYADRGEIKQLNGIVNRGAPNKTPLHWDKRSDLYDLCLDVVPKTFKFDVEAENADASYEKPVTEKVEDKVALMPPNGEIDGIPADKLQSGYDKLSGSLQHPAVATVGKKAGLQLGGGLATIWSTTGGRVALILSLALVIGVIGYVCYRYRKYILLGFQITKATIRNLWKGVFA